MVLACVLVCGVSACSLGPGSGDSESKGTGNASGKSDIEEAVNLANMDAAGASKAIPGFDVMDYGRQEDYVFGSSSADARHWDRHVLDVFEEHSDELAELFN